MYIYVYIYIYMNIFDDSLSVFYKLYFFNICFKDVLISFFRPSPLPFFASFPPLFSLLFLSVVY
jgi:hypothetical protein